MWGHIFLSSQQLGGRGRRFLFEANIVYIVSSCQVRPCVLKGLLMVLLFSVLLVNSISGPVSFNLYPFNCLLRFFPKYECSLLSKNSLQIERMVTEMPSKDQYWGRVL